MQDLFVQVEGMFQKVFGEMQVVFGQGLVDLCVVYLYVVQFDGGGCFDGEFLFVIGVYQEGKVIGVVVVEMEIVVYFQVLYCQFIDQDLVDEFGC